jgi:hypothetical protein
VVSGGTIVELMVVVWFLQPVRENANVKAAMGNNHFFSAGNFFTPPDTKVISNPLLANATAAEKLSGALSPDRNG